MRPATRSPSSLAGMLWAMQTTRCDRRGSACGV